MTEHPITPPRELVQQWIENTRSYDCIGAYDPEYEQCIALQAARWGSDQELDACCDWIYKMFQRGLEWSKDLRAARRPRPPSLKQQALKLLSKADGPAMLGTPEYRLSELDAETIRRALEQLDD